VVEYDELPTYLHHRVVRGAAVESPIPMISLRSSVGVGTYSVNLYRPELPEPLVGVGRD